MKKPIEVEYESDQYGLMQFRVNTITLGEVLNHSKTYPSLNAIMQGVNLEEDDAELRTEKFLSMLEAFNVIVALGVQYKDEDEWVSFDLEPGDDAITPGKVLPNNIVMDLGTLVIKNFRIA
jgi:hypothetical protein